MLRLTDYEWWKDPKWLPQADAADDDDGVIKDGESVRVPIKLMDSATPEQRKALDALHEDAARKTLDAAYDDYDKRIQNAWRNPPQLPGTKLTPGLHQQQRDVIAPTGDARERAREDYIRRLTNAWRTPR